MEQLHHLEEIFVIFPTNRSPIFTQDGDQNADITRESDYFSKNKLSKIENIATKFCAPPGDERFLNYTKKLAGLVEIWIKFEDKQQYQFPSKAILNFTCGISRFRIEFETENDYNVLKGIISAPAKRAPKKNEISEQWGCVPSIQQQ